MDNAQKAIMIGVGLFITIIIIAAVMAITGIGQNLLNSGQAQLGGISDQLQREVYDSYDNKELTGTEVLTAIKKYYNDSKLSVYVNNTGGTIEVGAKKMTFSPAPTFAATEAKVTGLADLTAKTSLSACSDPTQTAYYIAPSKTYKALVAKSNDAVVGIVFVKK